MKAIANKIHNALSDCYTTGEIKALTRIIATELLGVSQMAFFLKDDIALTAGQQAQLDNAIERLKKQEPIQYILGYSDFCSLKFKVTPATLIPRPETSELVEWVASEFTGNGSILDIGTGSGCIAISTLAARKDTKAVAVDIFPETVEIARENAERNGVGERFGVKCADVLDESFMEELGSFDCIISNPPYIESAKVDLLDEELFFEPRAALDGGADGLIFYRAIIKNYSKYLNRGGSMLFEIGYDQADALSQIASENGFNCAIYKDYGGNDRVAYLKKLPKN
jgi:release factor glutamine methyltransferase